MTFKALKPKIKHLQIAPIHNNQENYISVGVRGEPQKLNIGYGAK